MFGSQQDSDFENNAEEVSLESLPIVKGREIDPCVDRILSFAELAKEVKVRPNTVYQWAKHGRISSDRTYRVIMQRIKMPSGQATSAEAYFEFLKLLNHRDPAANVTIQATNDVQPAGLLMIPLATSDVRWICSRLQSSDPLRIHLSQYLES
ncbi:MAG: DNA-binding protein [Hyphomicrobiaceae bacterium]|nr:MAG: DNA-binding protein [Hyphomicrobiaceae bacterium]